MDARASAVGRGKVLPQILGLMPCPEEGRRHLWDRPGGRRHRGRDRRAA